MGFVIIVTILLGEQVNNFLGILGAVTGATISFIFPAWIHYKLFYYEMSPCQRFKDLAIVGIAIVILLFGTTLGIINWGA